MPNICSIGFTAVYEISDGNKLQFVEQSQVVSGLGADRDEVDQACHWLVDHGFLSFPVMSPVVAITPAGVDEAEGLLSEAANELMAVVSPTEAALIERLVREIETAIQEGEVKGSAEDLADLQAQIDSLTAQLQSPKPRRTIVGWALRAAMVAGGSVILNIMGNSVYDGLRHLLH